MHDAHIGLTRMLVIFAAGLWAGTQNTLAGGGSFITFPALLLVGLNPLAANMTSTIALFPMQITAALAGRSLLADVGTVMFRQLFIVSVTGGVGGAFLLLNTPVSVFAHLVPWLVLFATSIFAFSSHINWWAVLALGLGGIGGGIIGGYLMHRIPEKGLRAFVVTVGAILSIWLFVR